MIHENTWHSVSLGTYRRSVQRTMTRARKVAIIANAMFYIPPGISLPTDRLIASVNRLHLPRVRYSLFLPLVVPGAYLRPRVEPYFKRHISRNHASSTSKMSMTPAGFATTTSQGAGGGPSWRHGIVSLSRLATNYTLMRRRVIRRRCAKWGVMGNKGERVRDRRYPSGIYPVSHSSPCARSLSPPPSLSLFRCVVVN